MNNPANEITIASGSNLKKPDKKHNLPLVFLTFDLVNALLILGSLVLLLNGLLSFVRGDAVFGIFYLIFTAVVITIELGFNTYSTLSRTIFNLRCQDITDRKIEPLFAKLRRWRMSPGCQGNPYFCTASSLSIFRAFLGDTHTAANELRELTSEHKKFIEGQGRFKPTAFSNSDVRAVMLSNLGHVLLLNNDVAEATQKLEESIAIYTNAKSKSMGEIYPRADLARIMIDRLEFEEALQQLDFAMERLRDHTDTSLIYLNSDVETIICKAYAAVCKFKLGQDDAANEMAEEVISLLPTGPTKWTFIGAGHAISSLARVLIERGEITNAEQIVYMSSACLTCETHPDFLEFKAVSDDILKKIESRK